MADQITIGEIMGFIALFIISIFFIRWVFRIDRILDLLQKQYGVQRLIAEKIRVDDLELLKIDNFEQYKIEKRRREYES